MGKVTGFLDHDRKDRDYFSVKNRIKSFKEFLVPLSEKDLKIHDFNIKFETRKKGKSKMGLGVLFQLIKFISMTGLKKLNLINLMYC